MKKLLSIGYTTSSFNLAMFMLRVGAGLLMLISHGYGKLVNFGSISGKFMSFLGLSSTASLALATFAEFFCSIFIILGLFTRLATIPLLITMSIAVGRAHGMDFFGDGEKASLFFLVFAAILLLGPGRISVDGMINK